MNPSNVDFVEQVRIIAEKWKAEQDPSEQWLACDVFLPPDALQICVSLYLSHRKAQIHWSVKFDQLELINSQAEFIVRGKLDRARVSIIEELDSM